VAPAEATSVPLGPPGLAAQVAIAYALAQVGRPYVYGAAGPGGFDCSGLLMAAYGHAGVRLPHQSGGIAARGVAVPRGQWRAGDVLVWPGHVALYLGDGRMVHAPHTGTVVKVAPVFGTPIARRLV
jgi:cell wall-associated NlpC family hydrolase